MKALSATFALSLILQVRSSLGLLNSPHFHLVRFSSQNACVVRTSKKSDHDDIVTSRRVTIAPIPSDDDENGRLRRLRRLRNTYAHNREMDKLAKAGRNREAEELLLRLEEGYYEHLDPALRPDEISYNTAVHAHARARDAARAEEVLRRMSRYHREYHGRLAILSEDEEGLEEGEGHEPRYWNPAKPTARTLTSVLHAWKRTGNAVRAARVLDVMERSDDVDVRPDTVTYNTVVAAWASSDDPSGGLEAQRILDRMNDPASSATAAPDIITYNSVLHAWASRAVDEHGALQAEALLERLEAHPDLSPDARSHASVLDAWSRCGDPVRAEAWLDRMDPAAVNAHHLSVCVNAWARGDAPGRARRARTLAARGPFHLFVRNSVIGACAATRDRHEKAAAWDTAREVYEETVRRGAADRYTHGMMLKATANLLPSRSEERQETTADVFRRCQKDGTVNADILYQLRRAATPAQYAELVDGHAASTLSSSSSVKRPQPRHDDYGALLETLPLEWRRNAHSDNGGGSRRKRKGTWMSRREAQGRGRREQQIRRDDQ